MEAGITLWTRVRPLLDQAMTMTPEDRSVFLEQSCANDPRLRTAVERCLDDLEHLEDNAFMEAPVAVHLETLVDHAFEPESPDGEPVQIGPYQTVRELGYGGMGTVFLAERVDGEFEHQVALKLIKRGSHSSAVEPRFLHERQILARLKHPNIARLYDGGGTEDGHPYFVMEYVEGQPITDYCDAHQLSIKERLRLFLQACAALQYAHQNLVVHRDVKPSNILVTEAGEVKLLDFGIAKVLSEGVDTAVTQHGMTMLTPDYAAPEQVKGEAVTAATDVYALGVLLYELLSGRRPYRVQGASLEEWVRVICDTELAYPSQVVARQHGVGDEVPADALSTARGTTPSRLQRQLAGDLDTIVLKALHKEPTRRYGSVGALAEDVKRYLGSRPILARRDTPGYRLGKFGARHRFGIGVMVLLVLLVSGFIWQVIAERNRAEVAAAQATRVSGFLVDLFAVSDPFSEGAVRGDTTQVRVFLEQGASQIEALSDQEEVQSMLRAVLGRVYQGLGQYEEADGFFRTALAQRLRLYGEQSVEAAESMHDLGQLRTEWSGNPEPEAEGDVYDEGVELLRAALRLRQNLLGSEHPGVAQTLNSLSLILADQGNYEEAEVMGREALALRKKLLGDEHPDVATTLNDLANTLKDQGNHAEAEAMYRGALALWKQFLGDDHPHVATTLNNLGNALLDQGKYDEAEAMHREALALRKKVLSKDHPYIGTTLNNLALTLTDQGQYAEAEIMFREALALRKRAFGDVHPEVATTLNNLAKALYSQSNYAEAEAALREALVLRKRLLGDEHPRVASALSNLANILFERGDYTNAAAQYREALVLLRKKPGRRTPPRWSRLI